MVKRTRMTDAAGAVAEAVTNTVDLRMRLQVDYDTQLRTDAETPGAIAVTRLGPLRLVTFSGGRGFITYRDLNGVTTDSADSSLDSLTESAVTHFRSAPDVQNVEWKTRGHDRAPGLEQALVAHGFAPDEPETIMIGEARALAVDVPLPAGVTLRRVSDETDVRAMSAMQAEVFGDRPSEEAATALLRRFSVVDGLQLWVAEADGQIVSAGRLDPVAGTTFAGIWGGATRPEWRGRGIYRALTAERARAALALGKTLIHSDSTAFSRPILERSGLIAVSTTTPFILTIERPGG